jgi:hypothetical protein
MTPHELPPYPHHPIPQHFPSRQESMNMNFRTVLGARALAAFTVTLGALCSMNGQVQAQTNESPVAFVYVSSVPTSGSSQINAFAAASDGKLTDVPGSPFPASVQAMAVNGRWLFGADGIDIYSFAIASDGALKEMSSINAQQYNGYNNGGPVKLFFDHTGTTLYDEDIYGNNGANNTYQFFGVDRSTGVLGYLGATTSASPDFLMLTFLGDNEYAYGSSCYLSSPNIYGFGRSSSGTLTDLNIRPSIPVIAGGGYCPYRATAGPGNNVAISLTPTDGYTPIGPAQLAVYTADSSGNLTTNSTAANMPQVAVGNIIDIKISPSGRLLAAAGSGGLQVFHFNGPNPIMDYTGLLTIDEVDQLFWDNDNHLYAISQSAGQLYVFTVTPKSFGQAPGSPYPITSPQNVVVLSKTRECRSEREHRACTTRSR